MPTAPPPEVPNVFGQSLDPNNAQSTLNQYQQNQQIQNQSRQFSGREGGLGAGAGLLSKFIEGASLGRANADAKTAHSEAMKSAQDAQHLNSYIDMVKNDQTIAPGAKDALIKTAYDHQGKMAETILQESDSPIAKMLHPLWTILKGGDPADVSAQVDSKTGKKTGKKVKTAYKGPDDNVFESLSKNYQYARENLTVEKVFPKESGALVDQAKKAAEGLKGVLGNDQEPTRDQVQRAIGPLLSQGDLLAQRYGVKTNPVQDWLDTYQPKLTGTQYLQQQQGEQLKSETEAEKQYLQGGQQPTQTATPPSRDQFSLPTSGPSSKDTAGLYPTDLKNRGYTGQGTLGQALQGTPAQKDASTPPSAAIQQSAPGYMNPAFMRQQIATGRAEQKEEVVSTGDGSYKKMPVVYAFDGKPRSLDGTPIDPSKIGQPVITDKYGAPHAISYAGEDGKQVSAMVVEGANGEFRQVMIKRPGDSKLVPAQPNMGANGGQKTATALLNSINILHRDVERYKSDKQKIVDKIINEFPIFQNPNMSPAIKAQFDAKVAERAGPLDEDIRRAEGIVNDNEQALKNMGADSLGNLYGYSSAQPPLNPDDPASAMDQIQ